MCLDRIKKVNQKKDIICYKVFHSVANDYGGFSMLSIIRDYPYEMGTVHSTNTDFPEIKYNLEIKYKYSPSNKKPYIRGDSFHSFKTLYGAKKFAKFFASRNDIMPEKSKAILVVKCVIPSDSNFTYKGRFIESDFNLRSYASEKLKPIEIVTSYPVIGESKQNNNCKVKPVIPDPGTGDA